MKLRKIRALLIEHGIKHKDVAAIAGVKRVTVSVVLNGYRKSRPVQEAVAKALNMPYEKLWGKRRHKAA